MDNNQIDNNDVAFAPSVDAIQEFNLISQNAPASYGNYLGGIISVTIKSGSKIFTATSSSSFATTPSTPTPGPTASPRGDPYVPGVNNPDGTGLKPILRWNEFGGSVGGPIIKDKLFFFVDYQGSRYDQPATSVPYTVFTAAERRATSPASAPRALTPRDFASISPSSSTIRIRQPRRPAVKPS